MDYTLLRVQELLYGSADNMTVEESLDVEVGLRRVPFPFNDYLRLRRQGYAPLAVMGMVGFTGNQTEVEDTALTLLWERINQG